MSSVWEPNWGPIFFEKNDGSNFGTNNPKKDFMNLLVEKTKAAGHMFSFDEASADPDMIKPNSYAFYYGSYTAAAEIAWSKVRAEENLRKKELESMEKIRRDKGKRYTISEVRNALVKFYEKEGRLPIQNDIKDSDILPSWTILVKYLGHKSEWQAIIDEANPVVEKKKDEAINDLEPHVEETEDICELRKKAEMDSAEDEKIEVKTSHLEGSDFAKIEVKIALPDREKPIVISLTV